MDANKRNFYVVVDVSDESKKFKDIIIQKCWHSDASLAKQHFGEESVGMFEIKTEFKYFPKDDGIYLHDFKNVDDVINNFNVDPSELFGCNILLASYTYENYSGSAFVLYEKNGELFEVNASHCSCYGLEGQWSAEPTTVDAIWHRIVEGTCGFSDYGNEYYNELKQIIAKLKEKNNGAPKE